MSQHGCPERLSNRSKGFAEESGSQPTMEVLVETLTGTAFEMTVSPSDTVFAIKSKIFRVEGIPVSQQHLLYNLKELQDSSSLRELSITDGARLRLVLGMRGGPISTRRLPPPSPANAEPWPDIERLLDSTRDDIEWSHGGCKVTVLVFRDGERVNMLRVKENSDGTYSPIDNAKYTSPTTTTASGPPRGSESAARDNRLTMTKMMELRRRMDSLHLHHAGEKVEIQKTRSEETLSVPRLLDEAGERYEAKYSYSEAEDTFAPIYDRNYTRYPCELSVGGASPAATLPDRDYGVVEGGWSLGVRAAPPAFSASTSDLDNFNNNSGRMLPALSRHRPREHLHLSDEHLARHSPPTAANTNTNTAAAADTKDKKISRVRCGLCRKRLSISTVHRCRCGAAFCAPHRYAEVHRCSYDYKAAPAAAAAAASAPALPRI